ncbi:DUF2911 domain-containing protein [Terrimonas sp. NA20]|uniref:DUF2911 domain-containing protein n=1 Tax=Terrimonas ginsenosidimutans TaxID=2908004 RepID=A0ABS9L0D1_9BACT|nr:DUF2911 domain-containing protein [Terrimonas ginsenosidimutans]MCG2617927.1 DUF2911 domain-containing protein [Terrimonas ginsenosidimutans]
MKILQHSIIFLTMFLALSCDQEKKEETTEKTSIPADTIPNLAPDIPGGNSYAQVDISPMDMSYFPVDYPKIKMANSSAAQPLARVVYSRPHLQRRRLFAGILKYDEPWRLGANESTEIELFKEATIQGKKVKAGRYIMYCIPHQDAWTIIFNNNIDTWGLKQDPAKDVERFRVPATSGNPPLEYFTIVFEKTNTGADLIIGWDDVLVKMPMSF